MLWWKRLICFVQIARQVFEVVLFKKYLYLTLVYSSKVYINVFVHKAIINIKSKQGISSGSCWLRKLYIYINYVKL